MGAYPAGMNKPLLPHALLGLLAGALLVGSSWALLVDDERPAGAVADVAAGPVVSTERLELEASDGQRVLAWFHEREPQDEEATAREARRAKAPVAVLLHMYMSDHKAWDPLVPELLERGFAVLALDLRGHGENTAGPEGEDLGKRSRDRDADLFNAMHLDVAAAVAQLVDAGFVEGRVALVGASVGCSVAIDSAVRNDALGPTCLLTPGTDYLGVMTMEHVKTWGQRRLLVVSSEEERGRGADPIAEALAEQHAKQVKADPSARGRVEKWLLPETGIHGTRMFGKVEGFEARLADWLLAATAPTEVRDREEGHAGKPASRPTKAPK